VPSAVDRAHQRRVPRARHQLLAVHRGPEGGRRRRRPEGARRPRGPRRGGVRQARRDRARGARSLTASPRTPPLGPRHHEIRELRALVRDGRARRGRRAVVLEGARLVAAYVDAAATRGADRRLLDRLADAGVATRVVAPGVLERVASTVTPQPVVAVATWRDTSLHDATGCADAGAPVVVAVDVADPGNAGTIVRSTEAAGGAGLVFCGNSVDPHNPKVLRASAGAIFGIPVVEGEDPVHVLDALGA